MYCVLGEEIGNETATSEVNISHVSGFESFTDEDETNEPSNYAEDFNLNELEVTMAHSPDGFLNSHSYDSDMERQMQAFLQTPDKTSERKQKNLQKSEEITETAVMERKAFKKSNAAVHPMTNAYPNITQTPIRCGDADIIRPSIAGTSAIEQERINQTELDSLYLKDVPARYGFSKACETLVKSLNSEKDSTLQQIKTLSNFERDTLIQIHEKYAQLDSSDVCDNVMKNMWASEKSDWSTDGNLMHDRIESVARPNLDGSSSDSDVDCAVSTLEHLNLEDIPERQLAEGGDNNEEPFGDGGGGGDGSSGHSDDDMGGDGGVNIRVPQRFSPPLGFNHLSSDDGRMTPPNRERPVGSSGTSIVKQVQFLQSTPATLRFPDEGSSGNDDDLTLTLIGENENPDRDDLSRLSSRYLVAAIPPLVKSDESVGSSWITYNTNIDERTLVGNDLLYSSTPAGQSGIQHDCSDENEKHPADLKCMSTDNANFGNVSATALGLFIEDRPFNPFDVTNGSNFNGDDDSFACQNGDIEELFDNEEKLVAESNNSIYKDGNESEASEWSVRSSNFKFNSLLAPSDTSPNDGNISAYFKAKSKDLGRLSRNIGTRPKFSDGGKQIRSPQKMSILPFIHETYSGDNSSNMGNMDNKTSTGCMPKNAQRTHICTPINQYLADDHSNTNVTTVLRRKPSNPIAKQPVSNNDGHLVTRVDDAFEIPACKDEATQLFRNIKEHRVSVVGLNNSQLLNLARSIALLTGTGVEVIHRVLQILANNKFSHPDYDAGHDMHDTSGKEDELFRKNLANVATTGNDFHEGISDYITPDEHFGGQNSHADVYHPLSPMDTTFKLSDAYTNQVNDSYNTYKVAASITPYQVSSQRSLSSLDTQYRHHHLSNSENSSSSNEILQSRTSLNLTDAISYADKVLFNVSCIGVKKTEILKLYNSKSCWIEVQLHVVLHAVNGCEKDYGNSDSFVITPSKVVLECQSMEEVKIKFIPSHPGNFMLKVELLAAPIGVEKTPKTWQRLPKLLNVEGVCELPNVEIVLGESKCIDFGEVVYGVSRSRDLHILNKGRADVPLHLSLLLDSVSAKVFSFEVANESFTSISSIVAKGQGEQGGYPIKQTAIKLKFQAPPFPYDSHGQPNMPSEEYCSQLDIKLETEYEFPVGCIPVRALVGFVKLVSPKQNQLISLSCVEGNQASEIIPLHNVGNLSFNLAMKVTGLSSFLTVVPPFLHLRPGDKSDVKVIFKPDAAMFIESILLISVLPDGDQYKWTVRGNASKSIALPQEIKPTLLCNKRALHWPGVFIGHSCQQTLILRNDSCTNDMELTLSISGDQSNFQIQNDAILQRKEINKYACSIKPQTDLPVHVLFLPTSLSTSNGSLVLRTVNGATKFLVPLCGYGGRSQLDINGAKKLHNQFWIDLDEVYVGKKNIVNLMIRNSGSRAAFVSIKCYEDITSSVEYPFTHVSITPNNFVLKEKLCSQVTLTYQPLKNHENTEELRYTSAHLVIYSGDEVLRKEWRKHLQNEELTNESINEIISFAKVPDWSELIKTSTDKTIIALVARRNAVIHPESSDSFQELMLPVTPAQKIKQKSHKADLQVKDNAMWSITPQKIILNTNEDGCSNKVKIVNFSTQSLLFEFIWPGHTLIITPSKYRIPAQSQLGIRVSAKASFLSAKEDLPWKGDIYVQCNEQQKNVLVEICNDAISEQCPTLLPADMTAISANDISFPPQPCPATCESNISQLIINPLILEFTATKALSSSESGIMMTNDSGKVSCEWTFTSIAPPYLKCADGKSGIVRVTYTAFRFAKHSGILLPKESTKVPISFQPRTGGVYSQFWDVEVTYEKDIKPHKIRVEINGMGISSDGTKFDAKKGSKKKSCERQGGTKNSSQETVFVKDSPLQFPNTHIGKSEELFFRLCNRSSNLQKATFSIDAPFSVRHSILSLRPKSYIRVPVTYSPTSERTPSEGLLRLQIDNGDTLTVRMIGASC